MTPDHIAGLNRHIETAIPPARAAGIRVVAGANELLIARAPRALNPDIA